MTGLFISWIYRITGLIKKKIFIIVLSGVLLIAIILGLYKLNKKNQTANIGDYLKTYNDFVKEHPDSGACTSDVLVLGDEQTDVSKYALSWLGRWDLPYVFGGAGGRQKTLEQTVKYADNYNPYWGHIWLETYEKGLDEISPTDNGIWYGTDCVGFCCACYQHFGIYIHELDTMAATWDQFTPIDDDKAVPGDLVASQLSGTQYEHSNIYVGMDKDGNKYCVHTDYATGWAGPEWGYIYDPWDLSGCRYAKAEDPIKNNIAFPWLIKLSDIGQHQFYRVVSDIDDLGDGSKVTLNGFNEPGGN